MLLFPTEVLVAVWFVEALLARLRPWQRKARGRVMVADERSAPEKYPII